MPGWRNMAACWSTFTRNTRADSRNCWKAISTDPTGDKTNVAGNAVVVSPDVGGIKMARAYAKRLDADLAIIDKRRSGPHDTSVMHLIGAVENKNVILVDDMISTGGSILMVATILIAVFTFFEFIDEDSGLPVEVFDGEVVNGTSRFAGFRRQR